MLGLIFSAWFFLNSFTIIHSGICIVLVNRISDFRNVTPFEGLRGERVYVLYKSQKLLLILLNLAVIKGLVVYFFR